MKHAILINANEQGCIKPLKFVWNSAIRSKLFLIGVFLSGICLTSALAQSGGCGTIVSENQKLMEDTLTVTEVPPTQSLPLLNRSLLINVFVVKNKNSLPGVTLASINSAVSSVNSLFTPIRLAFTINAVQYIDNYQFDVLSATENMTDIMVQHTVPNTINLYLFSVLTDQYGADVNGMAFMPGDTGRSAVFIRKGSLSGYSLAHQLGHFFNLYDTHEKNAFGAEKVARTNCNKLGDRLCDTDADPNLEGLVVNCVYVGSAKDADGQMFSPSPRNIMSFTNDACRCNFTNGQYRRMEHCVKYLRPNLH